MWPETVSPTAGVAACAVAQAVSHLASELRRVEIGVAATDTACTAAAGKAPRLALVSSRLSPAYVEACGRSANARVITIVLGYEAMAVVAPAKTPAWPIT